VPISRRAILPETFAAIAFDLDGTLVNTLPAIHAAFNGVLAPIIGRPIPEDEVVSRLGPRAVDIMRIYDPENAETLIHTYLDYYLSIHLDHSVLYPGIAELIETLAGRGLKLGVVTSKRRQTAIPTLEHFGLMKHFTTVITEDDVGALKPDPEPILKTAEALGVDRSDMLVIGDNPTDMLGAHAAGSFGGAALWGYYGEKVRQLADLVFETPADVLKIARS
jgi:pyrophosphatase PpaX